LRNKSPVFYLIIFRQQEIFRQTNKQVCGYLIKGVIKIDDYLLRVPYVNTLLLELKTGGNKSKMIDL